MEETIQGRKLFAEIRYLKLRHPVYQDHEKKIIIHSIYFTFILSLRMVKLSTSVNFAITVVIILIWSTFLNIFLQFMRGKRSTLVNFVRNPLLHQQPEETMKKLQRNQGFALKVLLVQFWQMFERLRYVFTSTKAELVQVNHTPNICLRNFINKKVGNRKINPTFIIKSCILGAQFIRIPTIFINKPFSGN